MKASKKYIVSCSFGKDSLAMLLLLIEREKPIDEVVFYDTGMEFQAIYNIRDKVIKEYLQPLGIRYTELHPDKPFLWTMLDKPVKKRGTNEIHKYGYEWCGGRCRWGTTEKLKTIEKYCKGHYEYVGIAADEPKRLEKERKGNKLFPLAEWDITEQECLNFCRNEGFDWIEGDIDLYDILDRVSCWNCANKNLKELRNYYKHLPEYWQKLKDLQDKIDRPYKNGKTVYELEQRFESEVGNGI